MTDTVAVVTPAVDPSASANTLTDWGVAAGIAAIVVLLVVLVKPILSRYLRALSTRTATRFDDALVGMLDATRFVPVVLVAIYLGSQAVALSHKAEGIIKGAATVAAFLQVGLWLNALVAFWLERSYTQAIASNTGAATSLSALGFLGRIVLWAVMVLLALDNLGVNISTLIAGLGIGGIAVALAVQNVLGDLFASLSIVIDKPFVIGDFIIVDSLMGTVEHVGLKTTRLRSLDGEQIVMSNSDLLKGRIRNYKRMYERRAMFRFSLTYKATPEQLEKVPGLARKAVEGQRKVRFERAHLQSLDASGQVFEVVYWVTDPDYTLFMDVQQGINLALLRELAELGVSLAYGEVAAGKHTVHS